MCVERQIGVIIIKEKLNKDDINSIAGDLLPP